MTDQTNNKTSLAVDGAYLYLSSLTQDERVPRYRRNGLPKRATPLPVDLCDRFNHIGAPDTVRNAGK